MDEKSGVQICRTCLKQIDGTGKLLCIYEISHLLMSYTSVKIMENDGLPSNICNSCYKKANQAYDFKILCEESEQKLHNNVDLYGKFIIDSLSVKEEKNDLKISRKSENCTDKAIENVSDSFEFNLRVKEEMCDLRTNDDSSRESESCTYNALENTPDCLFRLLTSRDNNHHETVSENYNSDTFHNVKHESEIEISQSLEKQINDKPYRCRFCDMNFTQKTRFLKHEKKHEDGIKCSICGKAFSTVRQLRNHVNIHNRKGAHLCQTCGKQFTMPENLTRHQRIHNGIRPYKCKICNKSFTQSNELKSHMVTHSTEKTHLCNVCGNKYARHMSLQIHMRRLHSDASFIRPYCCEICGRAFKDKRDLSQHTLIHKDERKHICKVCSKAFNRASNLKVHERIHFGPRPFVCHFCQRSFTQKHVLNTHLKTHPAS